jgi:hypothetical protein
MPRSSSIHSGGTEASNPTAVASSVAPPSVTQAAFQDKETDPSHLEAGQPLAPVPALGPPPDGGGAAWMTVAGAFLIIFVQFGLSECGLLAAAAAAAADVLANSFGVFQGYYEDNYLSQYKSSEIAWIGGLQQFLLFLGVCLPDPLNSAQRVGADSCRAFQ